MQLKKSNIQQENHNPHKNKKKGDYIEIGLKLFILLNSHNLSLIFVPCLFISSKEQVV